MVIKLCWKDKYTLSLKESLTIKDIEKLFDCGQPQAMMIKNKTAKYCEENNLIMIANKAPTDVVLQLVGKDRNYFYQRMLDEKKLNIADDCS